MIVYTKNGRFFDTESAALVTSETGKGAKVIPNYRPRAVTPQAAVALADCFTDAKKKRPLTMEAAEKTVWAARLVACDGDATEKLQAARQKAEAEEKARLETLYRRGELPRPRAPWIPEQIAKNEVYHCHSAVWNAMKKQNTKYFPELYEDAGALSVYILRDRQTGETLYDANDCKVKKSLRELASEYLTEDERKRFPHICKAAG